VTSDELIDAAATALGIDLPADYRALMLRANGGESEFGESWVRFWSIEDLVESNAGYKVREFYAGFTLFGTNGGGEAYAWDWTPERESVYVVFPFIGFGPDTVVACGDTLEEFLTVLHDGIPFERPTS
jgi:hypothetical protein